jgi:hypothetical protein
MGPLIYKVFNLPYSKHCGTSVAAAQQDTPPDHLCQENFRYKEPVEPFVEPSALIPMLGHEGAARRLSTLAFPNIIIALGISKLCNSNVFESPNITHYQKGNRYSYSLLTGKTKTDY